MGESPAFVDLHSHTSASFDSLASPQAVVRAAAARGLTHLAVTDHDRIDGALRARDAAPDGLTVLVGEEIRTADGDLIAVFLERPVPPGLPVADTIAAVREQGGLVGVPHPFDRLRGSLAGGGGTTAEWIVSAAGLVDWI
jgi:predicted metal-dependent phosphoesterase TrpH